MQNIEKVTKNSSNPTVLFRRTVNDSLKAKDLPDLDEEDELTDTEQSEINMGLPVNIFDFCHELMEKGEVVSYEIYQHSTFMARKNHPYSWEQIQQDFGEGHFRVIARSERTKKYLKQETRFVGKPKSPEKETLREVIQAASAKAKEPEKDPFDQIAKMATLLKSLTPQQPQDNTSQVMMTFMQSMMSMQQKSQESTLEMIREMQKANQEMITKLDKNQRETMEKIEAKIENGKKDKGIDPMQLFTMLQSAEKKGLESYLLLEDMAEKKAARMSNGGGDEEESTTSKLIKTVLPAVATALQRSSQPQPQPQPMMRANPVQRPVPTVTQPNRVNVAQPRPVKTQGQPIPSTPAREAPKNTIPAREVPKNMTPKANVSTVKQNVPPVKQSIVIPSLSDEEKKNKMLETIMPIIGMKLLEAEEVELKPVELEKTKSQAAIDTVNAVNRLGYSSMELLHLISKNDMLDIAKSVGLPLKANAWLEDYYSHLEKIAVGHRQPAQSGSPSANESGSPKSDQ